MFLSLSTPLPIGFSGQIIQYVYHAPGEILQWGLKVEIATIIIGYT